MFKRIIWWATGAAVGAVGSQWVEHKAKQMVAEKAAAAKPSAVAKKVGAVAKSRNDATRARIREAIAEGRTAASDREAQLRESLRRR